jgi:hypothetical protein
MNIKLKNNAPKEIRLNNQSVAFEKTNTQFKIHFFLSNKPKSGSIILKEQCFLFHGTTVVNFEGKFTITILIF